MKRIGNARTLGPSVEVIVSAKLAQKAGKFSIQSDVRANIQRSFWDRGVDAAKIEFKSAPVCARNASAVFA